MPIYEYQCKACGHELEAIQSMSDAPLTDCPHCHRPELQKLVSAAGFQLKGTGWYATDFKDKNKTKAKTDKKDKSTTDSGSSSATDGATDTKPSTGTET